jgi:nitroreductase/NAD-dependent dihydropyrimidine dehydrogenase PreA subunit
MDIFDVTTETCNRDGICAAVCPSGLILMGEDRYPRPVAEADEVCIRCGHCVAACPTGSFSHRDMPLGQFAPVQDELQPTAGQCEHFLRNRRSIRVYKEKNVSKDEIEKLIQIARHAPSGHNSQCVEWLVLADKDELGKLAGVVADWMRWMIDNMPEFAASMHLARTVGRWDQGTDVILRNAPVLIVAHAEKDNRMAPAACTIALTYLELAATSLGLGCCWAGYFNAAATNFPPMMKALSLPGGHQSFGAMMVGYPKFKYHRLPVRKRPRIAWRLSEEKQ